MLFSSATVQGGIWGGAIGLGAGVCGVLIAQRRFHGFRQLTLPFKVFLGTTGGIFGSIVEADRAGRNYDLARRPEYVNQQETLSQQIEAQKPTQQRVKDWISANRYPIIFGSWVASMGIALGLVGRNPYLTGAQKLVQARVYAQGLTVGVLVGSFALEARDANKGQGRWETVKVLDPNDPTHQHIIEKKIHHERYTGEDQWMDMVASEEARLKQQKKEKDELSKSKPPAKAEAASSKSGKEGEKAKAT